jgi:hypothetical protein
MTFVDNSFQTRIKERPELKKKTTESHERLSEVCYRVKRREERIHGSNALTLKYWVCVTTDAVRIGVDLLTTYTHHSELQALTALSLISTLYKSP